MSTSLYVLNFDAELELQDPEYRRSPRMQSHCERLGRVFRQELNDAGRTGLVIDPALDEVPPDLGSDVEVVCWCPTPQALLRVQELGLPLPKAPGVEVLRLVNGRGFASEIEASISRAWALDGSRFHDEPGEALADLLSRAGPVVMKRAFGFAGRGQKRVERADVDAAVEAWVAGSFVGPCAGLVIEPAVELIDEWSVQGFAVAEGARLRRIVGFRSDRNGAFDAAIPGAQPDEETREALREVFEVVGLKVVAAGYRGPLAFDAFHYRSGGETRLRALSDLNARLTRTTFSKV